MIDACILEFDKMLRTLFASAASARGMPGADLPEAQMSEAERRRAAALMRVNHCGEICAQALYQGQALTSRDPEIRQALQGAAVEETEHLSWTGRRIAELGGRTSLLNPIWYTGSLALGALAGSLGDKWNLGFLAETERQVERHLDSHLGLLPQQDEKSRAILEQMKNDEIQHATTALEHGGAELPLPVKAAMKASSKIMTSTTYWL